MRKKKILIVNNDAWTTLKHRSDIIDFLKSSNFDVTILCKNAEDKLSTLQKKNKVIETKKLDIFSKNPIKDLIYLFELIGIYKKERPDLILHYTIKPNIYGNIAAGILKIPTISTINGLGRTFSSTGILNKIVRRLYKFGLSFAEKVMFQNNDDAQFFKENSIVKKEKIVLVNGSGVNIDKFNFDEKIPKEKFTVLLASRLVKEKGIFEFIEAANNLDNKGIHFRLLGPFSKGDISKKKIEEHHNNGIIDYGGETDNIINELHEASVVVLPSFYREGVPKIMIEALSCGKPIITTDNVGCKEVINDKVNGYMIPIKNSTALSESILKVKALDLQDYKSMCLESRKLAESKFDQRLVFATYINEIKRIFTYT